MRRQSRAVMAAMILAGAISACGFGTTTELRNDPPPGYRQSNTLFNNLPLALSTPGTSWAEPYALGRLKLLIIMPVSASHEAGELRSRLPSDIKLLTVRSQDEWVGKLATGVDAFCNPIPSAEALDDTASLLLGAGYSYSAIVIGKVKWTVIPENVRNRILERVRAGTALVFVSPWGLDDTVLKALSQRGGENPASAWIAGTVPLDILPLNSSPGPGLPEGYPPPYNIGPMEIKSGKIGSGNLVLLDYKDIFLKDGKRIASKTGPWSHFAGSAALTPSVKNDNLHYDYYYSILGKILCSAAGRRAAVSLTPRSALVKTDRAELPGNPVSFAADAKGEWPRGFSVSYELRGRDGAVVREGALPAEDGNGKPLSDIRPEIPRLPLGTYVLDAWLTRDGMVFDWASSALLVTGEPVLDRIEPSKEYYARGESIEGEVKFSRPPGKGMIVSAELWDTCGRLLEKLRVSPEDGRFSFRPVSLPLSRTCRIEAAVSDGGSPVQRAERWVGLPSNEIDDFQFLMWASGYGTRAAETVMRQCKANAVTGYYDLITWLPRDFIRESADILARNNLLAYPYCHGLWGFFLGKDSGMDSVLQRNLKDIYPPRIEAYRRYGTMSYSICEESHIERNAAKWDNPVAAADYALYLRERYGTIEKLNKIWGCLFKDFADIKTISFSEARAGRQHTRWMEQELHKVDRFNRFHEAVYNAVQKADPGAFVSLDCSEGMDYDWPRMAKIIRASTQSPLEYFNKNKPARIGTWTGYYAGAIDEWTMRTTPWKYLFQGNTHVIWFPVSFAFTPDLSCPLLCMRQTVEEVTEIEGGIGKLALASDKRSDPILMLWSNSSYYAGVIRPLETGWSKARENFDSMLRYCGFDHRAVDSEFLETSLSYNDDQKVLILPACQALSAEGVARIKAFARAGGLVVADFPPAVMDEFLRPNTVIKDNPNLSFKDCDKCGGAGRAEIGNVWQPCPKCGGAGKLAAGQEPPLISALEDVFDFSSKGVKACGKGYGLFLNGSPVRRDEWPGIRRCFIERAGLNGDIGVLNTLGAPRVDLRRYIFDNGGMRLLGLLPERAMTSPPGEEFIVRLDRKCHAYDIRGRAYLGEGDSFRSGILPCKAKFLAFTPARIEGVSVSLSKRLLRPGEVAELSGSLSPDSLSNARLAVRVEVSKEGQILKELSKNVISSNGRFAHQMPLALNQTKGEYRVKCEEIISGFTQELSFRVE